MLRSMRTGAIVIFAGAILLTACHESRARKAETALADAYLQQLQATHPGMTDGCVQKIRSGEIAIDGFLDNPDCFAMLPPQRWTGLWNTGWEWTNFCPAPAKTCGTSSEHGDIWLSFANNAYRGPELADGVYRIDFVGRRTRAPGYFGHLDQYDYLMVVDRVISIQKIPGEKFTRRF